MSPGTIRVLYGTTNVPGWQNYATSAAFLIALFKTYTSHALVNTMNAAVD